MRRWMMSAGSMLALSLLLAGASAEDKPKKPEQSETKQRLTPAGQVLGEVTKLDEGGKSFTLRIHEKVPQINYNNSFRPGGYQSYRNALQMFGRGNLKDTHTDIDIMLADEAKVRLPFKPEYDDQTKKLKPESIRPDPNDPDRKLCGLKGSEKDLKNRDWVLVTLGTTRDKPPMILATVIQVVSEPAEKMERRKDK
jgi:hypothetical protein